MTDETYQALTTCARSRIAQEWDCGDAMRGLLGLIVDLSYALGQSWAVVPCLGDFSAACGIHKSTACRVLRTAVQRGYLEILQRQGETLYRVCTDTRGSRDESAQMKQQAARERLVLMNQARLQGGADADGQGRLPGVFESEETEAPAAAFAAMVDAERVPCGTSFIVRPPAESAPAAVPAEVRHGVPATGDEDRLARLMKTYERIREGEGGAAVTEVKQEAAPVKEVASVLRSAPVAAAPGAAPRMEVGSYASQWEEMTRGLKPDAVHCLEMIREECRQRKDGEAQMMQYRHLWRLRAKNQTRLYLEAAGVHKAMRLERGQVAYSPGAFIFRSVEAAVRCG